MLPMSVVTIALSGSASATVLSACRGLIGVPVFDDSAASFGAPRVAALRDAADGIGVAHAAGASAGSRRGLPDCTDRGGSGRRPQILRRLFVAHAVKSAEIEPVRSLQTR
jgi:hypothetical protein